MQIYRGDEILHLSASVTQNFIWITVVNLSRERIPRLTLTPIYSSGVYITPHIIQTELSAGGIYRDCMVIDHCDQSFPVIIQAQWMDPEKEIQLVTCPLLLSPSASSNFNPMMLWKMAQKELQQFEVNLGQWGHFSPQEYLAILGQGLNMSFRAIPSSDAVKFLSVNPVILAKIQFPKLTLWTAFHPPQHVTWQAFCNSLLTFRIPSQTQLYFDIGRLVITLDDCLVLNSSVSDMQTKYETLRKHLYAAQIMEIPPWKFQNALDSTDHQNLVQLLTQIKTTLSPLG